MFQVTREFEFCFGHRLMDYDGKCRNLHGHNGKVCVTLTGDQLNKLGMIVDFVDMKRIIAGWIDATLDHTLLLHQADPLVKTLQAVGEKVLPLEVNPTTENMAKLIYDFCVSKSLPVSEVTMWETGYSYATYRGEAVSG
ncbi:6-carboxytetrahydropterin synthase QueD [Zavarzinella formosa]|uniref:6-carboxytetrahydropterin synthase QueD n=1 Tax=Zavarzinella formosa TaxID=360055 RepID=UPI00030C8E59|nr:6-carboxytetrahydropterin synthase QueD [Zavarzinella formosa]